jgi:hypothetical protein
MQSFTTTDKTNVTHAKVEFNNDFRRFSLETLNFTYLEQLLRTLFDIDVATTFKIQFLDDEKDWVLISSDEELTYASSLVGSPLRLSIKLVQANTPQVKPTRPCKEKIDWSDPASRKAHKISIVTTRIETLEGKLANQDIPAGKARALTEKVDRLKQKLENLKAEKPSTAAVQVKAEEAPEENCWGRGKGRGRGNGRGRCGRGGCGGRREWATNLSSDDQPLFSRVQECKKELRAARQAKNEEDIQAKWEALQQAKTEWRTAKFGDSKPGRGCKNHGTPQWEEFQQKKEAKRVCMMNLRKAREAGDQGEVEACRLALSLAKEDLFAAKLAFREAKHSA